MAETFIIEGYVNVYCYEGRTWSVGPSIGTVSMIVRCHYIEAGGASWPSQQLCQVVMVYTSTNSQKWSIDLDIYSRISHTQGSHNYLETYENLEFVQFSVPQIEYPLRGSSKTSSHVYFLLIVAMVLLLWCEIVLLWHQNNIYIRQ